MSKNKKLTHPAKRPRWFKCLTTFLKLFIKKPKYVYLGEGFVERSLILSNHHGAKGPLSLELYFPKPFRFWGTYEMNSSLKEVYRYLKDIYFYKKKHMKKWLATLVGFVVAPLAYLFYRGLRLISTYPDVRLKNTLKESVKSLQENCNLIIFPEDSSNGYFDQMTEFFSGFVTLANYCLKKGMDLPVYVTYLRKKQRIFVVDKPFMWSEVARLGLSKGEIAQKLLIRCNQLATIELPKSEKEGEV